MGLDGLHKPSWQNLPHCAVVWSGRRCWLGVPLKPGSQGLEWEALYHLSHTPSPFCFSYFPNKVSCLCLYGTRQQPSYLCFLCSRMAGLLPCPAFFIGWGWVGECLMNFLPGWPWTTILLISALRVTRLQAWATVPAQNQILFHLSCCSSFALDLTYSWYWPMPDEETGFVKWRGSIWQTWYFYIWKHSGLS
jgi:hypothetical protein